MKKAFLLLSLLLSWQIVFAQTEICNNGIDEDLDGLVDEADPDCDSSQLPKVYDQALSICEDAKGSGIAYYNLTDLNAAINGGAGNTITWYEDYALTLAVTNPTHVAISNGDTYYAEVDNGTARNIALASFTVNATDDTSFSYSHSVYCQNEANPFPAVSTIGGAFSAEPGLVIDVITGKIDLSVSSAGTYTVTYTTNVNCPASNTFTVTIQQADDASFSYSKSSYCNEEVNPVPIIMGNIGGVFSSTTGLVFVDAVTGEIDLSATMPGTHTITYYTAGICSSSSTFDVAIQSPPTISNLTASNISCSDFTISWDQVSQASQYNLQVAADASFSTIVTDAVVSASVSSFDVYGLMSSTMYFYRVGAQTDCGMTYSKIQAVTLLDAPQAPVNLLASGVQENSFTLTWDQVLGAISYMVEVADDALFNQVDVYYVSSSVADITVLQPGKKYCRVIAMNACGQGPQSVTIQATTMQSSLMQDSLALVALYHATDGEHWTRNDNWLTGPLNTWYGISIFNNVVYQVNLPNNNLTGYIPAQIGNLSGPKGTIFENNKIDSIAQGGIGNQYCLIRENHLTFEDILSFMKNRDVTYPHYYSPQLPIGHDTVVYIPEGNSFTIELGIDKDIYDNEYVWFKDSIAIDTTHVNSYTIYNVNPSSAGTYTCQIMNPRVPELILYSKPVTVNYVENENRTVSLQDSLALVALYRATDGEKWKRKDNWLTGPVNSWYGVEIEGGIIHGITLDNNNLTGYIPEQINNLTNTKHILLQGNKIDSITSVGLKCKYYSQSTGIGVNNNYLTFEDIISSKSLFDSYYNPASAYSPQAFIGQDTTVYIDEGDSFTIDLGIDENVPDNQYVWFKDDIVVDTVSINSYIFSAISMIEEGVYTCKVTNPRIEGLTLYSRPISVHVFPKLINPEISIESVCEGKSVNFFATGRHAEETYYWEIMPASDTTHRIGLPDSLASGQSFSYYLQATGDFIATVTLNSPYAVDTVLQKSFTIYEVPEANLPESIMMEDGSVTLTAIDAQNVNEYTFTWTYQDNMGLPAQNTIVVDQAGIYQVIITNAAGCQTTAEVAVINASKQEQSITFNSIEDKVFGDAPFSLHATASSGLAVSFELVEGQDVISLQNSTVTILKAGRATIRAIQSGNDAYEAAEPVSMTFTIHKAAQTIAFDPIADQALDAAVELKASASSGLEVTYTATGPAALKGNVLTFLDTGLVTVTASQAGNENFLEAEEVVQSFYVQAEEPADSVKYYSLSVELTVNNKAAIPALNATLYQKVNGQFIAVKEQQISATSSLSFEGLPAGEYTVGVHPANIDFLPAYLGNKVLLQEAKTIIISQDTVQYISLFGKPISRPMGESVITGVLLRNTEISNGRILTGSTTNTGEVLASIPVYLMHPETGEILAYATTDEQGRFSFTGLQAGSYLFVADCEGLPGDEAQNLIHVSTDFETVTITAMAADHIRVVEVQTEKQVTAVEETIAKAVQYFPNPVVDEVFVDLPVFWLEGEISISDASGKVLKTQRITSKITKVNLEKMSRGIYIITLSKGENHHVFKVLKQ